MEEKKGKKKVQQVIALASKVNQQKQEQGNTEFTHEKEIAMDFATKVHQKFDRLIKASILFGSQARNTATEKSDIDIIIIIDDAAIAWDMELIAWYREELGKMISASNYHKELHINTIKLTTWWQDLLEGDPVVVNILRYGEGLIDVGGFFNPLKILLQQGKIKSTVEAVYTALQRAPLHLARSKAAKIGAVEGIYWCMIDAAQAALITTGKLPPSPEHVPIMLKENFVDTGMLRLEYVTQLKNIYELHKSIVHGDMREIKGADLDRWQETAQGFLMEMTRTIDILIERNKKKK